MISGTLAGVGRLFFSAGEASGDAYGSEILERMRGRGFDGEVEAVGGARLRSSGAALVADSSRWGAIGIVEAFRVGPRVLRGYLRAKHALAQGPPGLFVPIDYGFINIRLARHARARGWKVLYFSPPGSWRRDKQGADLPEISDEIVTPFSWSAEILSKMGASVHWYGHPIKEMIAARGATPRETSTLAALPGSRRHEIESNVPVIAAAIPDLIEKVEFAVAPTIDARELTTLWSKHSAKPAAMTTGDTYGVLQRARAAIVCSGTATLEAALCACPCVVMYRGTKLMELEYRIRKPKFEFVSLPNILARRAVIPELLQWDASPERIRSEIEWLLADGPAREGQLAAFRELDSELGPPEALTRTAELAMSLVSPPRETRSSSRRGGT